MLRVRPGVELVRASFDPTRELITLDFPTFERPRKATSGREGAGNRAGSLAEVRYRARMRIATVSREGTRVCKYSSHRNALMLMQEDEICDCQLPFWFWLRQPLPSSNPTQIPSALLATPR